MVGSYYKLADDDDKESSNCAVFVEHFAFGEKQNLVFQLGNVILRSKTYPNGHQQSFHFAGTQLNQRCTIDEIVGLVR